MIKCEYFSNLAQVYGSLWELRRLVRSMAKMAAMPISGNQSAAGAGGLGIIRGKKVGEYELRH